MKNIHIGEIIKQKFEESQMSAADFARQIHHARSTVYDIFRRKSIDIDLLLRISEVLEYNFIEKVYLHPAYPVARRRYYLAVEIDECFLPQLDREGKISLLGQLFVENNALE